MKDASPLSRWLLISILIIVSMIPHVVTAFALGLINVALLALFWLAILLVLVRKSKGVYLGVAALFAFAMAIPPSPNYVGIDGSGELFWNPIGIERVFSSPVSLALFFLFYFSIFAAPYFLFSGVRAKR